MIEFYSPTRIVFGEGCSVSLPEHMKPFGKKVLVISGKSGIRGEMATRLLRGSDYTIVQFHISGEPAIETIIDGAEYARKENCETIISIGGGSVIDAGKAIAALINNTESIYEYLEVIGSGKPLLYPSIPHITLPTTAGTGAEVTKNAVLCSKKHHVKISLRSTSMYPTIALVDPELVRTLPPQLAASTGLDALTQCIESYTSRKATPFSDAISYEGMKRALRSIASVCSGKGTADAYSDMSFASCVSGIALSNSGLGAVHGFAGPLGGMCNIPHGTICALLLPAVIETNIRTLQSTSPQNPVLLKYAAIAKLLSNTPDTVLSEIPTLLQQHYRTLPIDTSIKSSVQREQYRALVTAAQTASSMKGNPVVLDEAELMSILEKTFN